MLPDRVSNPRPLTYESGALPIALRGPAGKEEKLLSNFAPFPEYFQYIFLTKGVNLHNHL